MRLVHNRPICFLRQDLHCNAQQAVISVQQSLMLPQSPLACMPQVAETWLPQETVLAGRATLVPAVAASLLMSARLNALHGSTLSTSGAGEQQCDGAGLPDGRVPECSHASGHGEPNNVMLLGGQGQLRPAM